MSKRKPYKRYSCEFKREALKRASEEGVTDRFICKELDISERQLPRWRDEFRLLGDDAFPGQGRSRGDAVQPWEGQFSAYRDFDGIRAPSKAEVWWNGDEGRFVYWRGQVTSLQWSD